MLLHFITINYFIALSIISLRYQLFHCAFKLIIFIARKLRNGRSIKLPDYIPEVSDILEYSSNLTLMEFDRVGWERFFAELSSFLASCDRQEST